MSYPEGVQYLYGTGSYKVEDGVVKVYSTYSGEWVHSVVTVEALKAADAYMNQGVPVRATALATQVGGGHYKELAIQPMEYSMANKLDACQHTAIKYITRYADKGGEDDLQKAIHCIQMLIEFKYPTKV